MEDGQTDDSNVNISFDQSGNLRWSRHVAHFKFDLRVSFAKAQDGSGQELGNGSDSEANPQPAGAAHGSFFCETQRGLGVLKYLFRPQQQHSARFRDFNFPAGSGEQRAADFLFQLSDFLAESGLRDEEPLRSSAKVQFASQHDKRMQFIDSWIHEQKLSQVSDKFIGRKTVQEKIIRK